MRWGFRHPTGRKSHIRRADVNDEPVFVAHFRARFVDGFSSLVSGFFRRRTALHRGPDDHRSTLAPGAPEEGS